MRSHPRRPRILALGIALLVALAGCSAYYVGEEAAELTTKSVVGSWVHAGPAVTARVTFNPDGTFTLTDVPLISEPSTSDIQAGKVKDDTIVDWSTLLHGSGTWKIRDDSDGSAPSVDLNYAGANDGSLVNYPQPAGGGEYLYLLSLTVKGSPRLFIFAGDGDLKYRFLFQRQ